MGIAQKPKIVDGRRPPTIIGLEVALRHCQYMYCCIVFVSSLYKSHIRATVNYIPTTSEFIPTSIVTF